MVLTGPHRASVEEAVKSGNEDKPGLLPLRVLPKGCELALPSDGPGGGYSGSILASDLPGR